MELTLDGERLTEAEIAELLARSDGLALIRGQWMEIEQERLGRMMEQFRVVLKPAVSCDFWCPGIRT